MTYISLFYLPSTSKSQAFTVEEVFINSKYFKSVCIKIKTLKIHMNCCEDFDFKIFNNSEPKYK